MVKVTDQDLYQLLSAEVRYAVARDNHLAPSTCAQHIIDYLPLMGKQWRTHAAEQLTSEIIQERLFNHVLKYETEWEKVLVFLTNYIETLPFGVDRHMDLLFNKPMHNAEIDYYSVEMHNKLIENKARE